jgi:hypothetical protein
MDCITPSFFIHVFFSIYCFLERIALPLHCSSSTDCFYFKLKSFTEIEVPAAAEVFRMLQKLRGLEKLVLDVCLRYERTPSYSPLSALTSLTFLEVSDVQCQNPHRNTIIPAVRSLTRLRHLHLWLEESEAEFQVKTRKIYV